MNSHRHEIAPAHGEELTHLLEGVQDAHLDLLLDGLDLDLDLGDFFGIGHGFWFGLTLTLAGRFLK